MIRKAISQFNWDKPFSNSNVNEKVYIFSDAILNILNFISHDYIMCDDRDKTSRTGKKQCLSAISK